jgi:hypothetical protein
VSFLVNKTLSDFNFCNTVKHEKAVNNYTIHSKSQGKESREMGSDMAEEGRELDRETGERSKIEKGMRGVRRRKEGRGGIEREVGEPSHFPNHSGRRLCFDLWF